MSGEAMAIVRKLPVSVTVYADDPRRCHPDCQFITKESGQYRCTRYGECVDNGAFDDTDAMYGFKRTEQCVKDFDHSAAVEGS